MAQALSNRDAHVDTGVGPVAWTPDSGEGSEEEGAPRRIVRRNLTMSPTWPTFRSLNQRLGRVSRRTVPEVTAPPRERHRLRRLASGR
jgi:hypothetical protein